jgi:hypothetical protein
VASKTFWLSRNSSEFYELWAVRPTPMYSRNFMRVWFVNPAGEPSDVRSFYPLESAFPSFRLEPGSFIELSITETQDGQGYVITRVQRVGDKGEETKEKAQEEQVSSLSL